MEPSARFIVRIDQLFHENAGMVDSDSPGIYSSGYYYTGVKYFLNLVFGTFPLLIINLWKTYKTQVPLYLSSKRVNHALEALLPEQGKFSLLIWGAVVAA